MIRLFVALGVAAFSLSGLTVGEGSQSPRNLGPSTGPRILAAQSSLHPDVETDSFLVSAAVRKSAELSAHSEKGRGTERWQWPTGEAVPVLRAFFAPLPNWLPGHRGVDLQVEPGTRIHAPAAGRVLYAGLLVNRPIISIEHRGGLRSTFEPVEPTVEVGQQVSAGQEIGTVLAGHDPSGLHFGAKYGKDRYVDPLRFILASPILKPWE